MHIDVTQRARGASETDVSEASETFERKQKPNTNTH